MTLAARWFRAAADQGDPMAQFNFALQCLKGDGVPKDSPMAARYLKLGADQGEVQCLNSLAILHATGDGVAQDPVRAYALWSASIRKGSSKAEGNLRHLASTMTPRQVELGKQAAALIP